jgi:hypothetical protein
MCSLENRVLRKIFGLKKSEVTGDQRSFIDYALHQT